jgi:GNAT superfamily N-acetyltransferase
MAGTSDNLVIEPWLTARDRGGVADGLDLVFFTSSGTQSFASPEIRAAFRERWLGRYLDRYPGHVFVAFDERGGVAGYVAGSLDDPAKTALFDDIGYFKTIGHLTARFPAQLHVNVRGDLRGAGLGTRLIQRFTGAARAGGAPGAHAVTGEGLRNAGFYERSGFREEGRFVWNGRTLVFLGLSLLR